MDNSDAPIVGSEVDNLFGIGSGRGKARRKAKRAAKRSGKKLGYKGSKLRRYFRDARQDVKAAQLAKKAARKGGKRGQRILKRSVRIGARGGRTGFGIAIRSAALAPLLPFKKAMKKALKRKGKYTPGMSFPSVVNTFYNTYVSKRNNAVGNLENLADNFLEDHESGMYKMGELDQESQDNLVGTISKIVKAIIDLFKRKKRDKDEGKKQSQSDRELAEATEEVTEQLQEEAEGNEPVTRKQFRDTRFGGLLSGLGEVFSSGSELSRELKSRSSGSVGAYPTDQTDSGQGRMFKQILILGVIGLIAYLIFKK